MAIAYFIPDQTKLLAASSNTNTGSQTNTNNNGNNNHATTAGTQAHTPPTPTTHNTSGEHSASINHNNNFRANITIPLSAYSATASHSDVGCWDLLTQIFCHALRFCHQSERHHSAVIQISFEISNSGTNGDTIVQVGAAAAPVQQTQQQVEVGSSNTTHSIAPSLVVHPMAATSTRCPSNIQSQHNVSEAASSERTTSVRPVVASTAAHVGTSVASTAATATSMSSKDLEPGTHKPSAKRN